MTFATQTDPGCVKPDNEDTLLVVPELRLFGICDGMGGMNKGGFASRFAADELRALAGEPLGEALRQVSQRLYQISRRSRGLFWTGTTAVLVRLTPDELELAHAGDSRAYILRHRLTPLTSDHSVSEIDRRMTRYVGQGNLEPTLRRLRWLRPARLLLCSDGLNKELEDAEIGTLLAGGSPQEACGRLVDAARERGGRDNISVIVVDGP